MGVEPELFVSDAVESVESRAVTAVSVGDSEAVTHSLSCGHVPDKITDLTASPLPAISDEASAAAMSSQAAAAAASEPRYSSTEATEAAQKQQKQHKTEGDGNKPHEGTPSDMKSRRNKKSSFRVICGHRELPK